MGDQNSSMTVAPGTQAAVPISIQLPVQLTAGLPSRINIQALSESGKLIGGVTYKLN